MTNSGVACGKKVVHQIEIIRGNFFACLFDLLLDVAEAVLDMVNGDGVQFLLLGGHGIPLLRAFCLFYSYAKQDCLITAYFKLLLKNVFVLSDDLLLEGLFFIGQNIGI